MTAAVIEEGTGLEMNATWKTSVQRRSLKLDVQSWNSHTFKNGLPYYGKVKVSNADDTPAAGISVSVCARPNLRPREENSEGQPSSDDVRTKSTPVNNYCAVRSSDENGIISYELLPNDSDISHYDIKVKIARS